MGARPWGSAVAVLVVAVPVVLPAAAGAQDAVQTLRASGESGRATAEVRLPAAWRVTAGDGRIDAAAPGGRRGCEHRVSFRLRVLRVAASATAPAWVLARLDGQGDAIAAGGGEDAAFLAVARRRASRAIGLSARRGPAAAGDGRAMAEVVLKGSATRRCRPGEARKVVKRLGRLAATVRITDVATLALKR